MNATPNDKPVVDGGDDSDEELMLFAMGALDLPDAERVAARVAGSPDERRRLLDAQELVGRIGQAAPQGSAPAALRERVLAEIDERPAAPAMATPPPRRSRWPAAYAALAAVVILVLVGVSAILWMRLEDREDELTALQAELTRLADLPNDQPLVWTPLSTVQDGIPANGWLARTPDGEVAWVILEGPTVDPEHVLQLWLIDGETPHGAGTFVTDSDGRGLAVVQPQQPLTDFELFGITVEPEGGSPAPTTNPFVLTEIS